MLRPVAPVNLAPEARRGLSRFAPRAARLPPRLSDWMRAGIQARLPARQPSAQARRRSNTPPSHTPPHVSPILDPHRNGRKPARPALFTGAAEPIIVGAVVSQFGLDGGVGRWKIRIRDSSRARQRRRARMTARQAFSLILARGMRRGRCRAGNPGSSAARLTRAHSQTETLPPAPSRCLVTRQLLCWRAMGNSAGTDERSAQVGIGGDHARHRRSGDSPSPRRWESPPPARASIRRW